VGRSGIEEFREVISDFKNISSYALGGSAVAPLAVTLTSKLGPPWPPGMGLLTSLAGLIAIIAAFHLWFSQSLKQLNKKIIIALVLLGLSFFSYLFLWQTFTFEFPTTHNREARGFILTHSIKPFAQDPEYDTSDKHLAGYEYDAGKIWETWSITTINLALVASLAHLLCQPFLIYGNLYHISKEKSYEPGSNA
jgi:hypothetical protein